MSKQIFQTDSTSRWKHFKWTIRLVGLVALFFAAVFLLMFIFEANPVLPFKKDYRSVITAQKSYLKPNKISKEYKKFRDFFHEKKMHNNYMRETIHKRVSVEHADSLKAQKISEWNDKPSGIRSAWYVTWDPESYLSLKRNIGKVNLIIPEWFFINPKTGKLETAIDTKGYELIKHKGVPIMPMLTNNFGGKFRDRAIGNILQHPKKRIHFINELLNECQKRNFCGINIDLEELNISNNEYLTAFIKELCNVFHKHNLYVTQDIMSDNRDYNLKELAQHLDYLFLMAYDEHMVLTEPGDISSQQWIANMVDKITTDVPPEKLVLGIAAYGYDWNAKRDNNQAISYEQALAEAEGNKTDINFDPDTYNLNFAYEDDSNQIHQVYFTDAATHWNIMRFGTEYGLAGFGLWRLGSEDERLWKFYNQDMRQTHPEQFDLASLEQISGINNVNYLGEGEVLYALSSPKSGHVTLSVDSNSLVSYESYQTIPSSYELRRYGTAEKKEIVLTFDDGPDKKWTPQILHILKEENVPAAFFMVGIQMERNLPIVKQVYEAGHLIGNHTFTHHNIIENSPERTAMELKLTRMLIECITGRSTILFRAPYNADSDPTGKEEIVPIVQASHENYVNVGESIDPNDWQPGVTKQQIVNRVMEGLKKDNAHIILLHDAGGDTREATVHALPAIIDSLKMKGYKFITLEQYLGKTRNELMPSIAQGEEYYAMEANLMTATFIYKIGDFIAALFIAFLFIGMIRLIFMWTLTIRERCKMKHIEYPPVPMNNAPDVSIIVPAYNEEINVVSSLKNLLQQDYPNFKIIFVDDGSRDETLKRVKEALDGNPKIQILTKPNGGKASALNFGIAQSTAEYVVCIDADTKLLRNAVSLLMRHYLADKDRHLGAVAGNVKVGNTINMLTRWQAIEYTTSQNFDRMAYAAINAITVVPGAIGAFRKSAIEAAGGFTTDTLAEDCDLTIRILKAGYVIDNENEAIALTEAPEKLKQFVKQRTRWCFGVMQTFWKHRHAMFEKKYKGLGIWALPNMLVFQFIIPTFSPIADVLMLLGLFSGNAGKILLYYLLFLIVDASVSIVAYLFEREKMWVLLWIIPQRFAYRWIMYYVLFKSYIKAIKGELQSWGVLKRTGNVGDIK